jgi:thiamine-phosphate pyrophosphorylase
MTLNLSASLRLLLVTDDTLLGSEPLARLQAAVAGGATAVQLRLKQATDSEWLELARSAVARLPVPIIINDRLDIALAAGAAGVHLGATDLAPELARRIVPPGFVIGASVGDQAEATRGATADYWGIGPFRTSTTKPDAGDALGLAGLQQLHSRAAGRPCVAIGGIQPEDVSAILALGFSGVAVAGGILGAASVTEAAGRYAVIARPKGPKQSPR